MSVNQIKFILCYFMMKKKLFSFLKFYKNNFLQSKNITLEVKHLLYQCIIAQSVM